MSAFGLDIGTSSIKVVSLKRNGNRIAVESLGVGATPPKGMLSESPDDLVLAADAVKKVVASANIKEKNVNLSLPENQVYTKIVEMPSLSEKELAAALKYEMEQYVPLPLEQVKTDWQILGSNGATKGTTSVFIVAAPIQIIEKYEGIMEQAGFVASTIETEILSVVRSLFPIVNTPTASIVVQMGATSTTIAVIRQGEILTVFTVDKGGLAVTRAISLDLGIDLNQAESYKKAYGLNKEAFEGKVGKSLFPILESILGDIRKTLLLFKEKFPEEQVNQVILSGGAAQLPGIDIYFTNQLNIQVVLGNVFQIHDIQNVPPEIASEALSFNVVAGLALKDLQ